MRRVVFASVLVVCGLFIMGVAQALEVTLTDEPDSQPASETIDSAWNPAGTLLAVCELSSPFLVTYERDGDDIVRLSAPATLPDAACRDIAWTPDGLNIILTLAVTPYINLYDVSGTTFTKLTSPTAPSIGGGGFFTDVSSYDVTVFAQGQGTDAYRLWVYTETGSGSSFALTFSTHINGGDSGQLIAGQFNSDGTLFAASQTDDNNVYAWSVSGGGFTPITFPDPGVVTFNVAWSPDSSMLAVSDIDTPAIRVYDWDGATFTLFDSFTIGSSAIGLAWDPTSSFLMHSLSSSPYVDVLERGASEMVSLGIPGAHAPAAQGKDISWTSDGDFISQVRATADDGLVIYSSAPSPPGASVAAGGYVECQTFALNWTLPSGDPTLYNVTRTSPDGGNRTYLVPPNGNFTLRLFNDTFPPMSTTFSYRVTAFNAQGWGPASNLVNFTPPNITSVGSCGLIWGPSGQNELAEEAGVSPDALGLMVGIIFVLMGAGFGAYINGGAGAAAGAGAGVFLSIGFTLLPLWVNLLLLMVTVAGFLFAAASTKTKRLLR